MAQMIELWIPGQKTTVQVPVVLDRAPAVGMASLLWQGLPDGQVKLVGGMDHVQPLGHVKLWMFILLVNWN